ncbi:MAG: cytochrome c biogenesis protein CcsA [bacterium]|nr:cytochrome c biogenesis protein CcsA [bacterium]
MNLVLSVADVLLPLLYLVAWSLYLWVFRSDNPLPKRLASRFALAVAVVHLTAVIAGALALGRLPMGTPLEFVSTLALAIVVTYLAIERRFRAKGTGFFPVGVAFFLQFVASAFSFQIPDTPRPYLADPGFAGHAVLALLAYTALTLSFVYALLYLVLARQLGRKSFGLLFRRLPSLETLERMSVAGVELGVPLLFASLALGHMWMYSLADRLDPTLAAPLSPWDPKVLVSWIVLLGYLGGLIGHRFLGWRGKRMNLLAVAAFLAVVLTMGVVRHFVPSFHDFQEPPAAEAPTPAVESRLGTGGGGGVA